MAATKKVKDLVSGDLVISHGPRRDKVWEVVVVDVPIDPRFLAVTIEFRTVTEDGQGIEIARAAMLDDEYRLAGPIQSKRYRADAAR